MPAPEPRIIVQAFPLDAKLSFYRLQISDEQRVDVLAQLVEKIEERLADLTSDIKANLAADGDTFILAFLADKHPTTTDAVRELAEQAAHEHTHDHQ